MKRFLIGLKWMVAVALLSACQDDSHTATNGREVSLNLSVRTTEMQPASGKEQTRSTSEAMDIAWGGNTPDTRAKNQNEMAVRSLWLVQFSGNNVSSTVVKSGSIVRSTVDETATFAFAAVNATCRVYVVANIAPSVTVGITTMGDFVKSLVAYSSYTDVAEAGLPMCGYADFNPTTTVSTPLVSLKAMVAKLTVTYTVTGTDLFKPGTTPMLTLKNLPSGTTYGVPGNLNAPFKPTGVTYANKQVGDIEKTYTFYVPENIAGVSATTTTWEQRTVANIPPGTDPFYLEITGRTYDDKAKVTITSFIGDPAKPAAYNIVRNTAYTLTATIKRLNTADERITVTPGFDLNEGGLSANCYIVTAADAALGVDFVFDATVRGNNATAVKGINYYTLPDLSTATEARVIWQTGTSATTGLVVDPASVKLQDRKVLFTLGDATEGNAVIGIFASDAADAPCLWSWHIWRVNTAPGTVTGVKTSATTGSDVDVVMMNRNLGAFNNTLGDVGSIGLLYQWGRKDPFPSSVGVFPTEPSNIYGSYNNGGVTGSWTGPYVVQTSTSNATIGTERWAVQYPTAYIFQPDSPNDWYWGGTRNDNLWGTPWTEAGTGSYNKNQGTKSIYDPCPIGYRVPPQDTWSKQTVNGTLNGYGIILDRFHPSLWFPAGGNRTARSGVLSLGNSYGYYWVSSPRTVNSTTGGSLYFYSSGTVYPLSNSVRADAVLIRCVKE